MSCLCLTTFSVLYSLHRKRRLSSMFTMTTIEYRLERRRGPFKLHSRSGTVSNASLSEIPLCFEAAFVTLRILSCFGLLSTGFWGRYQTDCLHLVNSYDIFFFKYFLIVPLYCSLKIRFPSNLCCRTCPASSIWYLSRVCFMVPSIIDTAFCHPKTVPWKSIDWSSLPHLFRKTRKDFHRNRSCCHLILIEVICLCWLIADIILFVPLENGSRSSPTTQSVDSIWRASSSNYELPGSFCF